MTPLSVACYMASLFSPHHAPSLHLLDAGAGIGSLTSAFLDRLRAEQAGVKDIVVTAYEIDPHVREHLEQTLSQYAALLPMETRVFSDDFIEDAVNALQFSNGPRFTHAILNPPYKKIGSHSRQRLLLRQAGIETVNLYSAFVALAVAMLEPGGQLVAIVPRSFCNGPYYRPFREFILARASIRHLHLFDSRDKAFKDDEVLQENIIVHLEKNGIQGPVTLSTARDDRFDDYATQKLPFEQIILPGDKEQFIHIPVHGEQPNDVLPASACHSLAELGIEVSTGPVVDFRMKEHLLDIPMPGSAPLLYPCHIAGQRTQWPKSGTKKPNALALNETTRKWLYPNGFYTVVKRFTSKEEKRRIVAGVVLPETFDATMLGFENHLNVFHRKKQGLPEALARGLAVYLNSSVVDFWFRRFSGHTQVNVADLKKMRFPDRNRLESIGRWAKSVENPTQEQIDDLIKELA